MKILLMILLFTEIAGATSQKNTVNSLENKPANSVLIDDIINDLYINKQDKVYKVYTSTPTIIQVRPGTMALYKSGTIKRVVFNIADVLYYINLTAW